MKNLKYYILTLACILGITSCSLDETNYTEVGKDNYMKDASEAQNVLLGIYRNMIDEGMYKYNLSLLFTIPTDIAKGPGNSTDGLRLVPANAYGSNQSDVQLTWASLYAGVYCANDFLEALQQKIQTYDEKNYKLAVIYMAEARALRALHYFELVRWFRNIALITNTSQSYLPPSEYTQANPIDVYKYIEKDLLYAIDNLPYAVDDNLRSNSSFRLSKGSALGLLTKVYATWASEDDTKWEKAAQTAKVLVESGKHHLLSEYDQLWKNTCNGIWDPAESLIEISFYTPNSSVNSYGRIGKWNGVAATGIRSGRNAGNWRVIPTFLRDWKDRDKDLRAYISVADYNYTGGSKRGVIKDQPNITFEEIIKDDAKDSQRKTYVDGMYPAKWDTELYVSDENYLIDQNYSNINWYVLRYADVLLLYAEALNEWKGSPTPEAYAAINMVRRRGFGTDVNTPNSQADLSGLDGTAFRKAVRDERAYELAFEGHRRQDLIRWGIYYDAIQNTQSELSSWCQSLGTLYICSQYTQKNKHELLPIPLRDMSLLKQFDQNPGWGK